MRSAWGTRSKQAAFLLCFTAVGCSPAHSEPKPADDGWVVIADDETGLAQVDSNSLTRTGMHVRAQLKVTPRDPWTTPNGQTSASSVHTRAVDCSSGAFVTERVDYRAADGAIIEEEVFDAEDRRPMHDTPGTRSAHYTASICKVAGLEAPLLPNVSLLDWEPSDWRRVGVDPDGATVSVIEASARTLDGAATIVTRTDYTNERPLSRGLRYRSIVNTTYFVCGEQTISVGSSDYYSGSGELLHAEEYDIEKKARRASGTGVSAQIEKLACAGKPITTAEGASG